MLKNFFIIGATAVFIRQVLAWVRLLQIKEYRFDRLQEFFSSPEGWRFFASRHFWISLGLAVLILIPLPEHISLYLGVLIWALLCLKKWPFPRFTAKATILSVISTIIFLIVAYFQFATSLIYFPIMNLLISLIVLLSLILLWPVDFWLKRRFISQAKQKRSQYSNVRAVGITGSYGKTSVKSFLSQILAKQVNALVTPEHVNTEMGVAQIIKSELDSSKEIIIAEMGAYKKGEIAKLCQIIRPNVGIITGVDEQHVALFGTIDKTAEAKQELIDSLPDDGLAILSADNEYTRKMAEKHASRMEVITYGESSNATVKIDRFTADNTGIIFFIEINGERYPIRAKLLGKHNAHNLTAAFLAARELGLPEGDIIDAIAKLKPLRSTLATFQISSTLLGVDDSYNANPTGVISAINFIKDYYPSHRKILVLDDIIELGKQTKSVYNRIVPSLKYFDQIYYIGKNYGGMLQGHKLNLSICTVKSVSDELNALSFEKTVILFEGRAASEIIKKIKK